MRSATCRSASASCCGSPNGPPGPSGPPNPPGPPDPPEPDPPDPPDPPERPEPRSGSSPGWPGKLKPKGGSLIAIVWKAGWNYHIRQAIPGAPPGERPSC